MKMLETITIARPATPAIPPSKSARPFLLKLGQVVITPGALAEITDAGQTPFEFLLLHMHGNWGELSKGDKDLNDMAVHNGERILSAYRTGRTGMTGMMGKNGKGVKIWVITEADRSSTCILLPEEY